MLVAFTVTAIGEDTLAAGTYKPSVEIVPHAAPAQLLPATAHVTAVFEFPVTLPTNC
jgi:hypothetical protein